MTKETQTLYEELAKLLDRTLSDCMSTLIDLSGNLTDIECGTLIKIPQDAGYVKFYKSSDSWKVSLWISPEIMDQNLNKNDET